jgi:hypothetical protein
MAKIRALKHILYRAFKANSTVQEITTLQKKWKDHIY